MDIGTAAAIILAGTFTYSAWLTSIVFCSAHDERPLLIAAAAFFPVGVAPWDRHLAWRVGDASAIHQSSLSLAA